MSLARARTVFTLTEATLVADNWGSDRYAALNSVLYAPLAATGALVPGIGAGIAAAGSYPALSPSSPPAGQRGQATGSAGGREPRCEAPDTAA
jgi:hypothetical protein